jgi:hypothetical protein
MTLLGKTCVAALNSPFPTAQCFSWSAATIQTPVADFLYDRYRQNSVNFEQVACAFGSGKELRISILLLYGNCDGKMGKPVLWCSHQSRFWLALIEQFHVAFSARDQYR